MKVWQAALVIVAEVLLASSLHGCGHDNDSAGVAKLILLPGDSPGKCLDGTPGGFYFSPSTSSSDSTKWVIRLEGGGECASEVKCKANLWNTKGSSRFFPKSNGDLRYLTSRDDEENPAASTWNHVLIMYCSQDLWSGTRQTASDETWGLYFSGHFIFQEVVKYLKTEKGLDKASEVILSGESAGGIGVWINYKWLRDALQQQDDQKAALRLVMAPLAGFYGFAHKYTGAGHTPGGLVDFSEASWPNLVSLWQSNVDKDCRSALGERWWSCMLSNYSRPHVGGEAFVIEAQTDKIQLTDHDDIPPTAFWNEEVIAYVNNWKMNMTYALHSALLPNDGYFFPACYVHTEFYKEAPLLSMEREGSYKLTSYGVAFGEWYDGASVRLEDTCGIRCGKCPPEMSSTKEAPIEPPGLLLREKSVTVI